MVIPALEAAVVAAPRMEECALKMSVSMPTFARTFLNHRAIVELDAGL